MKTKELIWWLEFLSMSKGNNSLSDDDIKRAKEIIKRLEEYDKLGRLSYRAFKLLEEIVHL